MSGRVRPPDILYIVVDCARAADFGTDSRSAELFPNWTRFARDSFVFDHAVAPSSWTLPSHASMFTGQYPWEHGVLHGGAPALGSASPTLARRARESGYATSCFSANPLISAPTGLIAGFETALSGRFLDCYLRPMSRSFTGPMSETSLPQSSLLKQLETESGHALRSIAKRALLTFPAGLDLLLRSAAKIRSEDGAPRSNVASWIEPELQRWLGSIDRDRPSLAFVNLLDAHEPYLCLPEEMDSFKEWFALMRVRQDSLQQFFGTRMPPADDLRVLHQLYIESLRVADRRLKGILSMYANLRDVDNTLIIVTSDHGQAFGEGGQVYHGRGTTDEIVRVPLAVRFPTASAFQGRYSGWFSTARIGERLIAPFIDGAMPASEPSGWSRDPATGFDETVYAISDNYDSPHQFEGAGARAAFSGSLAAYRESTKVELSLPTRKVTAYDVGRSSGEEVPVERSDSTMRFLVDRLSYIASTQLPEIRYNTATAWTRLAAWGYDD